MLVVLGWACVAWTSFELIRLWNAQQSLTRVDEARSTIGRRMKSDRLAAWDDRGRSIVVEDVGSL